MRNARLIRQAKGLTLKQVDAATGIDYTLLSRFEVGAGMHPSTITKLAEHYGVTEADLMRLADAPEAVTA